MKVEWNRYSIIHVCGEYVLPTHQMPSNAGKIPNAVHHTICLELGHESVNMIMLETTDQKNLLIYLISKPKIFFQCINVWHDYLRKQFHIIAKFY